MYIVVQREGTRDVFLTRDTDLRRMALHKRQRYVVLFETPYFRAALDALKQETRAYRSVA